MENGVAKVCKTSAVIVFILGAIGTIIWFFSAVGDNAAVAFLGLLAGLGISFVSILGLYGLGELISQATIANANVVEIWNKLEQVEDAANGHPLKAGEWKCSGCGTVNPATSMACKDCGKYKD